MSNVVKIELTEQARRVVANLQTLPPKIMQAIAEGMDLGNQAALTNIIENHLTGRGPFPPEMHRLGERSHQLRNSARTSPSQIQGERVTSAIGSQLGYAGIHEFGGRIHHKARKTKVRLRTDRHGSLVRQLKHSNLAMFARSTHKQAKEVTASVGEYDVDMPERAPFRTGIKETAPRYGRLISRRIVIAFQELNQ